MDIKIQQAIIDNSLVFDKIYENLGKKISNISQTDFQAIHNVCFINFEDGSSTLAPSTGIISVK